MFSLPLEAKACWEEGGRNEHDFEDEVIVHLLRVVAYREQGLGSSISAAVRGERRQAGG